MPNYEVVNGFCNTRNKAAIFPATFVAEPRGTKKMLTEITDCFSKDEQCNALGCKYAEGANEPSVKIS